jgi:hypothetical protein
VDDEAPARLRLRGLLAKDCEVVGIREADNGEEAVRVIRVSRTYRSLLERRLGEAL